METDDRKTDILDALAQNDTVGRPPLHEAIYQDLRARLARGAFAPGDSLSLRSLANILGGSVTPVRDAVWRLTAEHALSISPTRRIQVPVMDARGIDELMRTRLLLEPEAAARALPFVTTAHIQAMEAANDAMNDALRRGDVVGYMAGNHGFHFALYRACQSDVLVPMIEGIWVRFGPFMRLMFPDAVKELDISDRHHDALTALHEKDEVALRAAIAADVQDGLDWMLAQV